MIFEISLELEIFEEQYFEDKNVGEVLAVFKYSVHFDTRFVERKLPNQHFLDSINVSSDEKP